MKYTDIDKDQMQEAFKVPEGYFESLPDLINQKINDQNNQSINIVTLRNWIIVGSVAASIAVIFSLYIQKPIKNESKIEIALNKNEIFELITNDKNLYEISDELIYEELAKSNINESINDIPENSSDKHEQLTNEDIINYLIEEDPNSTE